MAWYARIPALPVPAYCLHQLLWTYLPEEHRQAGAHRPFVYLQEKEHIHVISRMPLSTEAMLIEQIISSGKVYQFKVLCSPSRGGKSPDGKRLRRLYYRGNEERREWLSRRLEGCADVLFCSVFDRPERHIKKPKGVTVKIEECVITGTLRVTDKMAFISKLCDGVGGRGAWGCGLLYLPEVMGG